MLLIGFVTANRELEIILEMRVFLKELIPAAKNLFE
jgi:hypothetical protein